MYGSLSTPTLVVYATRACSYACVHCSTSASPAARTHLGAEQVVTLVGAAAQAGFTRLVVSGGEPLGWPGLDELLSAARLNGMERILETSGVGLDEARAAALAPRVDRIAIAIDGPAPRHDVMHGRAGAFAAATRAIHAARAARIPVCVSHALRVSSLPDLDWLAEFCVEMGVASLRIQPLTASGRAAQTWAASDVLGPAGIPAARARIAELAYALRGRLPVIFDADDAAVAETVATALRTATPHVSLSRLLPQIVLEEDGTLVPLRHGFPRDYALGNIGDRALPSLVTHWHAGPAAALSKALDRAEVHKKDRPWFDLGLVLRGVAA